MEDALARRILAVLATALLGGVLSLSACRTATSTWESSADFRLQNVEAALLQVQEELKQLEARQSGDDKKWEEARAKLDELLNLLRTRGAAPAGAMPAAPPESGPAMAAAQSPAPAQDRNAGAARTLASLPRSSAAGRNVPVSTTPAASQSAAPAMPAATGAAETPPAMPAASASQPARTQSEAAARAEGRLETKPKLWETLPPSALSEEGRAKMAAMQAGEGEKVSAVVGGQPPVAQAAPAQTAYAPSAVAPSAPTPAVSGAAEKNGYKEALWLAMNGQTAQSKAAFNAFLTNYPASPLTPNALYWIGECDYNQKNYAQSILSFQTVVDRYPGHQKAADSLFKIGMAQEQLGDRAGAAASFQALAARYPESELAGAARSRAGKLAN